MRLDAKAAAEMLLNHDNIVIFAHRKPDGDAIGSSFALLRALESLGKKCRVECADNLLPGRFGDIFAPYEPEDFKASLLVAVDVADISLLAGVHEKYARPVDLCIDHHKSNSFYALNTLLNESAAAAAEVIYELVLALGANPSPAIADGIFTGLSTDTGGFRFANTTPDTHIAAAEMLRWGARGAYINRLMFETKSRGRLLVDKMLIDELVYACGGKCAIIFLAKDIAERFGVDESELDGVSALPRTIEGVYAGVTIREKTGGEYRISLRTRSPVDASRICSAFGGGGHLNAAGCTMQGKLEEVRERLIRTIQKEIESIPYEQRE